MLAAVMGERTAAMRRVLGAALVGAIGLGAAGCSYFPTPPDPIRYVSSPADVNACRRLGSFGIARTDGVGPYDYGRLTAAVPGTAVAGTGLVAGTDAFAFGIPSVDGPETTVAGSPAGQEIIAANLAEKVNVMRDYALAAGATDLYLSRRVYKDWSFIEGIGYRCRH